MAMFSMSVEDNIITQSLNDVLGIKTVGARFDGTTTFYLGWRDTAIDDDEILNMDLKKLNTNNMFDVYCYKGYRVYELFNRYRDISLAFKKTMFGEGYFYLYTYKDDTYKFLQFSEIEDCIRFARIERKVSYLNTVTYVRVLKYLYEILNTTKILSLVVLSSLYWYLWSFLASHYKEFAFLNESIRTPVGAFSWLDILLVFGILSAVLSRVEYNIFEARSIRATLRQNLRVIRLNRFTKPLETFKEVNPYGIVGEGCSGGMF